MTDDTAHTAKQILDDAAALAKAIGMAVCPEIVIPVSAVDLLIDLGFADYFRILRSRAASQTAAQTAGVAAAEAQAATTALERMKREGSACRPCLETFAGLIDEEKART